MKSPLRRFAASPLSGAPAALGGGTALAARHSRFHGAIAESPRAAFGVTPQGAALAARRGRFRGALG